MNTDFEDSELKEELETTKYMFFIFKEEKEEYQGATSGHAQQPQD